jgi:signal transduction histidine kinase/CheY-like chemotaxis protein
MAGTAPSGLACCGELEWGAHFCQLYETCDDLIDTLVPFFAAGLSNHERCLWVTSEPLNAAAATAALATRVPDLSELVARGQIEIVDHAAWYARAGILDPDSLDAACDAWVQAEQDALARGYSGLRVTGNTSFLRSREDWRHFERYEARVAETFAGRKLLGMCSYHLGSSQGRDVLDVVRNHQFALARRDDAWEVLDCRIAERTAQLEAELADARRLQEISAAFVAEERVDALYQKLVDAAAAVMRSDFASMQAFHPACEGNGKLELLAHRGFTQEAAQAWRWVHPHSASICGMALGTGERVIVPDVETCTPLALAGALPIYRQTGIRAVQSTPLRARDGALVGMISTHWRKPHAPAERELRLLDIVARQAADLIERNRAAEALRARTAELVEADQRKDEFLATLAHELRNPLAPIRTGLAILKAPRPEAIARVVAMMDRQLGHMVRLVDDLLDVSRVSRDKVTLQRERVRLRAVIDSALETSRPLLDAAKHQLIVTVPAQPLWLEADATRVAQIISNIINNSAKYTPEGGEIRLIVEPLGAEVAIHIADNGIGIPREMLTKVFDLFAQVGDAMDRSQGGLGLGLSLARKLAELHGGSITADSDGLGRGATFTVRLPLAAAPSDAEPGDRSASAAPASCRILVVDDNIDAAEMLAMLLNTEGHTTCVVTESCAAVDTALHFHPDAVFLDIGMPHLNGFEVARRMRQQAELGSTMLVALTGWGAEEDRDRSRKAGFDHHLTKPVLPSAVHELLADLRPRA